LKFNTQVDLVNDTVVHKHFLNQ